jgi:acyl-CoA synthetase (AMP-forming)/AMP-acid ligase II
MTGARAFRVLRRLDGAVQDGGVNVIPDRIAEMLEQHPLVARAAVRLAPDGGRLKALIVPAGEVAEAVVQTALTAWIAANLSAAEQPRSLTFAAALPAGGYGKPADWQEAAPALSPEPEPALA